LLYKNTLTRELFFFELSFISVSITVEILALKGVNILRDITITVEEYLYLIHLVFHFYIVLHMWSLHLSSRTYLYVKFTKKEKNTSLISCLKLIISIFITIAMRFLIGYLSFIGISIDESVLTCFASNSSKFLDVF